MQLPNINSNQLPRKPLVEPMVEPLVQPIQPPQAQAQPELVQPLVEPLVDPIQQPIFEQPWQPDPTDQMQLLADYHDPYQINSIADAVLTTFDTDMDRRDWGGLEDIPIVNIATSLIDIGYNYTYKPIREGEWGIALLNQLTNVGETLSAPHNILKGLAFEGPEGMIDALGWGGRGRHNFDFIDYWTETPLVVNLGMEVLTDPLNWASGFIKGTVGTAAVGLRGTLRSTIENLPAAQVARRVGKTVQPDMIQPAHSFQVLTERVGIDKAQEVTDRIVRQAYRGFMEGKHSTMDDAIRGSAQGIRRAGLIGDDELRLYNRFLDDIHGMDRIITDASTMRILDTTKRVTEIGLKTNRALLMGALTPSGIFPFAKVCKLFGPHIGSLLKTRAMQDLNHHLRTNQRILSLANYESINLSYRKHERTMNMALRLAGKKETSPTILSDMLRRSLNIDGWQINKIFKEHGDNLPRLEEELIKYLQEAHGVKNLRALEKIVREVNALADDSFVNYQRFLREKRRELHYLKRYHRGKDIQNVIKVQSDSVSKLADDLHTKLGRTPNRTLLPRTIGEAGQEVRVIDELTEMPFVLDETGNLKRVRDLIDDFIQEQDWPHRLRLEKEFWDDPHSAFFTYRAGREFVGTVDVEQREQIRHLFRETLKDYFKVLKRITPKHQWKTVRESFKKVYKRAVNDFDVNIETYRRTGDPNYLLLDADEYRHLDEIVDEALSQQGNIEVYVRHQLQQIKPFIDETSPKDLQVLVDFINQNIDDFADFQYFSGLRLLNQEGHRIAQIPNLEEYNLLPTLTTELELSVTSQLETVKRQVTAAIYKYARTKNIEDLRPLISEPDINRPISEMIQKLTRIRTSRLEQIYEPHYRQKIYETIGEWKEQNVREQSKIVDKMIDDRILSEHGREKVGQAVNITKRKEIMQQIYEILGTERLSQKGSLLPQHKQWIETNLQGVFSTGAFEDALDSFLRASIENITTFAETHQDLNRLVKLIMQKTESVTTHDTPVELIKLNDLLDELSPEKIIQEKIRLEAGVKNYQFKAEELYKVLDLTDNPQLVELIEEVQYNSGLGGIINELADGGLESAVLFRELSGPYEQYLRLLENITRHPGLSEEVKTAFSSVMMHPQFAHLSPQQMLSNFDFHFNRMVDEACNYINSSQMKQSLSIEKLVDAGSIPHIGRLHSAQGDALQTRAIMNLMPEYFDFDNFFYITTDIESSGLRRYSSEVLELASVRYDNASTMTNLNMQTNKLPTDSTLRTLVGEDNTSAFLAKFAEGETDPKVMFTKWLTDLQDMERSLSAGKKLALVYHGGDNFDVPLLLEQMRNAKVDPRLVRWFEDITKEDSLKLLRKKYKHFVLEPDHKMYRDLRDTFLSHVQNVQENTAVTRVLDPNNRRIGDALRQLQKDIDDITKRTSLDALPEGMEDTISVSELNKLSALNDALHNANENIMYSVEEFVNFSNAHSNKFLDSRWLEDGRGLKFFFDHVMSEFPEMTPEQFNELYGHYLNLSKLLYRHSSGPNYYGYKIGVNHNAIMDYFSTPAGTEITPQFGKAATKLAKRIDYIADSVKNPVLLKKYEQQIKHAINLLIPGGGYNYHRGATPQHLMKGIRVSKGVASIEDTSQIFDNSLMRFFRNDQDDIAVNYALLEILYDEYQSAKQLMYKDNQMLLDDIGIGYEIIDEIDEDLLTLLDPQNRMRVKLKGLHGTEYTRPDTHIGQTVDASIGDPDVRRIVNAQLTQKIDELEFRGFRDMDGIYQENNYVRSQSRAYATNLRHTKDMLDYFSDQMDSVPIAQQLELLEYQKQASNILAKQEIQAVLQLTDPEIAVAKGFEQDALLSHMLHRAPFITFDSRNITANPHLNHLLARMYENADYLDQIGIGIKTEQHRVYLYLKKDLNYRLDVVDGELIAEAGGRKLTRPVMEELNFRAIEDTIADPTLMEQMEAVRESTRYLSDGEVFGSRGQVISPEYLEELYHNLPDSVKAEMLPIDHIMDDKLFRQVRYNFSNLGDVDSQRVMDRYAPGELITSLKKGSEATVRMAEKRLNYIDMYYDPSYSINNGPMATFTDEQLLKMHQDDPHYVFSAIVDDADVGHRCIMIKPNSVAEVREARRLNAIVIPEHTYKKMHDVINKHQFSNAALNFWQKINYMYKVGFLADPGVWFRNWIDSTLKTLVSSGGDLTTTAEANVRSARMLKDYNQIVDDIINLDPKGLGRYTRQAHRDYFDTMRPSMNEDMFNFVHDYLLEGPSSGIAGMRWGPYYKATREASGEYVEGMWQSFVNLSQKGLAPNSSIEQINRLAYHIILSERGYSTAEAYHLLAKTHFDYAFKSNFEKIAELFFPFYTFTMRNLEYWCDSITRYPWVANMFSEFTKTAWEMPDLDHYELAHNKSLQYNILAGNIPLFDDITLKTAPSLMDAFRTMHNPIATAKQRLGPPFQTMFDGATRGLGEKSPFMKYLDKTAGPMGEMSLTGEAANMLPVLGPIIQRYGDTAQRHFQRTGFPGHIPLPGVFGSVFRFDEFTPRTFPTRSFSSSSYARTPRVPYGRRHFGSRYSPRSYSPRSYSSRSYSSRSFARKAPNMRYTRQRRYDSFYKEHYTPSGHSRMELNMLPVTSENLHHRIRQMWGHIR